MNFNAWNIRAAACAVLLVAGLLVWWHAYDTGGATIGGTQVPAIHCAEDELIGFHGVPDDLACIHYEAAGTATLATGYYIPAYTALPDCKTDEVIYFMDLVDNFPNKKAVCINLADFGLD